MFLLALRRLRRYLFVYLSSKFSTSCFNAFRRALFALSVFYAIWLYFQLFRKFFRRIFRIFFFLALRISARDRTPSLDHTPSPTSTRRAPP